MSSETCVPPAQMTDMGLLLLDSLVAITVSTLFYGISVIIFPRLITIFIRKGHFTRAQKWMLLASTASFLLSTLREGALIAYNGIYVHSVFIVHQDICMVGRLADRSLRICRIITNCADTFELVLSDAIVVGRAFVLLQHKRWLTILPSLLLLGAVVSALLCLSSQASEGEDKYFMISLGLSLGANVFATSLIGYVYWVHRKSMATGFRERPRRTQGEQILAILVESGVVFCVLQTAFIAVADFSITLKNIYPKEIFTSIFWGFTGMYPTIVVVLVNSHRAVDEAYIMDASLPPISLEVDTNHAATPRRISFATPDSVASTDEFPELAEKKPASGDAHNVEQ